MFMSKPKTIIDCLPLPMIFALSMLLFVSCADDSSGNGRGGGIGDMCISHEDCNTGLRCNSMGQCVEAECQSDEDCPEGMTCSEELRCVEVNDDTPCTTDLDCPAGEVCGMNGFCKPVGCASDADCSPGEVCNETYGMCVADSTPIEDGDEEILTEEEVDIPAEEDVVETGEESEQIEQEPEIEEEPEPLPDQDGDGIPDEVEDRNGNGECELDETCFYSADTDGDGLDDGVEDANQDGIRQMDETDPTNPDSDYDQLFDGVEDGNKNGQVDEGETDPLNPDCDDDGIIDGIELLGNYTNGNSSDPLNADTDGDTLPDGEEDENHNGQVDEGETDPTLADTDGDGTPDNEESVNLICREDQITDVLLYSNPAGEFTLALLPDFDYVDVTIPGGNAPVAAAFEDPALNLAGFIITRAASGSNAADQVSADNALLMDLPTDGLINHRGRPYDSYDGHSAMTSHHTMEMDSMTVGQMRNSALGALAGVDASQIADLPEGPAETGHKFEVLSETLVRDNKAIGVYVFVKYARYNDTSEPTARYRAIDLTDGSALSLADADTFTDCDPYIGSPPSVVDFLWVVDKSGSMSADQQAVADAAGIFATILGNAGIDYRLGVTSTGVTNLCPWLGVPIFEAWCANWTPPATTGQLGDHNFTRDTSGFQHDIQNPPGDESEYGLLSGWMAIDRALEPGRPTNEALRPDASLFVIFLSDEDDQLIKNCEGGSPIGCSVNDLMTNYKNYYTDKGATCFAIVGDTPDGCGGASEGSGQGSGDPGDAYIDVAYHTGGSFASICTPDFTPVMEEIIRAAAGSASVYELSRHPISSSIQVMVEGEMIPRSQSNGFEYDAVSENIVFYGDGRPEEGTDVVFSYRYFSDDPKNDE